MSLLFFWGGGGGVGLAEEMSSWGYTCDLAVRNVASYIVSRASPLHEKMRGAGSRD